MSDARRVPRRIGDVWILAIIAIAVLGITRLRVHTRFIEKQSGVVEYDTSVEKQPALKLADSLVTHKVFDSRVGRAQVSVSRESGCYKLKILVSRDLVAKNPALVKLLQARLGQICNDAFGKDEPASVYLMDLNREVFMDLTDASASEGETK